MHTSTDTRRDLEELARGMLWNTPYHALRRISCEYQEGALILRGEVPSYYLKQMAQTAVAPVGGAARIVNHIDVVPTLPHTILV
jgi:hypothetical protein